MGRKYTKYMSRRTFLRGAGTVCIGVPFLDAMRVNSVFAQGDAAPARAFHMFFSMGCPHPLQNAGWTGPLEPLAKFQDKMLMVRGIDQGSFGRSVHQHFHGSSAAFTGTRSRTGDQAGGPSFDQVILRDLYQRGARLPAGTLRTVAMGSFFRRDYRSRFEHCTNEDGHAAATPHENAQSLFRELYGALPEEQGNTDPATARALHVKRSILDAVKGQIDHYASERSNLGASSRRVLSDHFQELRQYELQVFGDTEMMTSMNLVQGRGQSRRIRAAPRPRGRPGTRRRHRLEHVGARVETHG